ncbi:MAG TPA: nuclear transport factor 2 family protein [Candidatus Binataceae bacterium]|jgi:ketosteroid isomerase-like protein|nr:nuclear transport factor 2 family protein [Candidatus Binataceae bacterium]
MSDRDAVLKVNRAFYRAFEALDLEQMEAVWLREQRIACVHPGWRRLNGWGPVMTSWERIFQGAFEMKFELRDEVVTMSGDLAVVLVEENLTQRGYDGGSRSQVLATNVFERADGQWLMILHHGSPVMAPPDDEPPLQ